MAKDSTIKPFSQQPVAGPLKNSDLLLIAQPWAQGLEGYKTVNINVKTAYDTIIKEFKTTGITDLGVLGENSGLLGKGTVADPLHVDSEWVRENYAIGSLVNVSQVGNLNQTALPIGQAATGFSYPIDGMSRMTLASTSDSGFETIVPVTDGFTTTYNYGSGEILSNGIATYTPTEGKYLPRLPDGYDESQYVVEQIFSCSKAYIVLKLRHVSDNRALDELAVVATHGTLDGAYHTTYFLTKNNLYTENLPSGSDARRLESKLKYVAWEQGGKLYLARFDIQPTDTSIGSNPKRELGLVIYQLLSLGDYPERLTPLAVKGIKSQFLGQSWDNTSVIKLTNGYYGNPGAELDLSVVTADRLEFIPLSLESGSQALDRFLDVLQYDENHVEFILSRCAQFYVKTATGSRQQMTVNYVYSYLVDMVNKKIVSKQTVAKDYQPKMIAEGNYYSFDMRNQPSTLWDGPTGRIQFYCEGNLSVTSPVTPSGESTVTVTDSTSGDEVMSATITTTGSCCASISSDQIGIPLGTGTVVDSQDLMFLSGDEITGYQVGGLKIQSDDTPTYSYVDVRGETIQGYSLDLERFTQQQTVDGVNLSSYTANYVCMDGHIFDSLDGVWNTSCQTRFGLLAIDVQTLLSTDGKTIVQHQVELDFTGDGSTQNANVTPIETYLNYRTIRDWIQTQTPVLNKGSIKFVPFFDGSKDKMFIHLSLDGGIGVGPLTIHLVAECTRSDNDYIIGAVEENSVIVKQQTYDGDRVVQYEQPDLHNATVFTEVSTGKVAIFYGNFGEYSNQYPYTVSRVYQYGFSEQANLKELPYSSNFGLVTYYLDKTNGISFTSKDSWLQILHTTEQVPFDDMVPSSMMRTSAMLLAAPSLRSGYYVKVLEPIPFFMSGVNGEIPIQDISLEGIPLSNGVGKGYLYLGLVNGNAKVELRTAGTAERPDYALIAVVTMDVNGFVSISAEPFIRLGPYRLSTRSKGSAIPVTAPRPDIQQFTLWD